MPVFSTILAQIIPLYLLIVLGFIAGRRLKVDRQSVATVLVYLISPVVFFASVSKAHVDAALMVFPLLMYGMSTLICFIAYFAAKKLWNDNTPNIMALAAGTGNTGYFGLPVALLLFDEQGVGVYFAGMLGVTLFESSIGFYMTARGQHTAREAFMKVLKLPALYAFILGLIAGALEFQAPKALEELFLSLRGAYVVLGMMIIGLGLSGLTHFRLDMKFTGFAFLMRYALWPLLTLALIAVDSTLGLFGDEVHRCMLLLSIVPLAANTVVFATLLNVQPEKVASTVLLSTLIALAWVPLMVALLF